MRKGKPDYQIKIAKERIKILFEEARKEKSVKLSDRYMELVKKISMRYNIRIHPDMKKKFCRKCCCYFNSKNSKRRYSKGMILITCLNCDSIYRIKYKK